MLKEIYFINVSDLSKGIASGEIGHSLMFRHFIIFSILFYSGFSVPISLSGESTGLQGWGTLLLIFAAQSLINYYGIWYTYQINEKGDGRDYFYRLFSLALPISVRLLVCALLISVVTAGIFFVLFSNNIEINSFISSVFYIVLLSAYSGAFYYLAGKYIRVCSSGS
ncbi:hypothetical protein [Teredinibacter turnerae]|uniref:hypothetical protein n=1 Tax=Teredinibacter turnerae TaxID=2426 RepID=UPI00048EB7DA|nr:hypothetical protein [Teredinibacter turnerae]